MTFVAGKFGEDRGRSSWQRLMTFNVSLDDPCGHVASCPKGRCCSPVRGIRVPDCTSAHFVGSRCPLPFRVVYKLRVRERQRYVVLMTNERRAIEPENTLDR